MALGAHTFPRVRCHVADGFKGPALVDPVFWVEVNDSGRGRGGELFKISVIVDGSAVLLVCSRVAVSLPVTQGPDRYALGRHKSEKQSRMKPLSDIGVTTVTILLLLTIISKAQILKKALSALRRT